MDETPLSFSHPAGHRIPAVLATPTGDTQAIAILCHGFLSTKNSSTNKALSRMLTERGIATLRFDFWGQGESLAPFERITVTHVVDEAHAALSWASANGYRHIGLVGSSFGGLVALLVAPRHPTLRALALKCPVPDFPELLRLEFGEAGMAEWQRSHTIPDVTGRTTDPVALHYGFFEDCLRHSGYDAATHITAPTLIVQGDEDELVPVTQSQRLAAALAGPSRLEILTGADHGFTKAGHFHQMTGLIVEWLSTHLLDGRPTT
ncbi:MAG: alpha/beta fold hydrolase [Nitrospiraceae bacterium]